MTVDGRRWSCTGARSAGMHQLPDARLSRGGPDRRWLRGARVRLLVLSLQRPGRSRRSPRISRATRRRRARAPAVVRATADGEVGTQSHRLGEDQASAGGALATGTLQSRRRRNRSRAPIVRGSGRRWSTLGFPASGAAVATAGTSAPSAATIGCRASAGARRNC
jgi:hypothetical protein